MEYIFNKTLKPKNKKLTIDIPEEYINQDVEVKVIATKNSKTKNYDAELEHLLNKNLKINDSKPIKNEDLIILLGF